MALFVFSVLSFSLVSALDGNDLFIAELEVNEHDVNFGAGDGDEIFAVEEGETIEVDLALENLGSETLEDLEVEIEISGFEYNDFDELEATTELFNIKAGTTKKVSLDLDLPHELENDENYWLRVRVMDKNTAAFETVVQLSVEAQRHAVDIADVSFAPSSTVKAGRHLFTTVLLENFGEKDEEDVKVSVSIPQLGVSAFEIVDEVNTDDDGNFDFEDVPEMALQIPSNTAAGTYELVVSAQYDNFHETVTKTYQIQVVENEMFQEVSELTLQVGPQTQSVLTGATASYFVALMNTGTSTEAYTVDVVAGDWASVSKSDALVVLGPGQHKIVTVDVTPNAGTPAAAQAVAVTVSADGEELQTVMLEANVVPGTQSGSNQSLRDGLEIALIVLVVLLVVIGLIIGFSRLRRDDEGEDPTYY